MVAEQDALWIRTPKQTMRLWPSVSTPHRFRGHRGWMTFVLKGGRAESFNYNIDDGFTVKGVRLR